jgi:hypothetical protein
VKPAGIPVPVQYTSAGPSTRVRINGVLVLRGPGQGVPHPLVLDMGWVPCVGNGVLHAYLPRRSHSPFVHLLIHAMRSSVDLHSGFHPFALPFG